MASYTPKGDYFDAGVSDSDKALLNQYSADWAAADARGDEAAKAEAHAKAEAVRGNYGYSGGADGSEYLAMTTEQLQQRDQPQTAQMQAARNAMLEEYQNLYNTQAAGQNSAYQQMLAQQQAAQEAATQKAVNTLESRKAAAESQYAALYRQLYIDKMKNRKNLDQRLAAQGITGGAAETTALSYDTAYEDALRQGEQGRIGVLSDLDAAIADARLTGDLESAKAAADAAKEQTDAYSDALKYLIQRQDAIDARQESYAREDAQRAAAYARQQEQERKEAEEKEAEEAKKALVPRLTYAQVLAEIKKGTATPEIWAMYEYYRSYGY